MRFGNYFRSKKSWKISKIFAKYFNSFWIQKNSKNQNHDLIRNHFPSILLVKKWKIDWKMVIFSEKESWNVKNTKEMTFWEILFRIVKNLPFGSCKIVGHKISLTTEDFLLQWKCVLPSVRKCAVAEKCLVADLFFKKLIFFPSNWIFSVKSRLQPNITTADITFSQTRKWNFFRNCL